MSERIGCEMSWQDSDQVSPGLPGFPLSYSYNVWKVKQESEMSYEGGERNTIPSSAVAVGIKEEEEITPMCVKEEGETYPVSTKAGETYSTDNQDSEKRKSTISLKAVAVGIKEEEEITPMCVKEEGETYPVSTKAGETYSTDNQDSEKRKSTISLKATVSIKEEETTPVCIKEEGETDPVSIREEETTPVCIKEEGETDPVSIQEEGGNLSTDKQDFERRIRPVSLKEQDIISVIVKEEDDIYSLDHQGSERGKPTDSPTEAGPKEMAKQWKVVAERELDMTKQGHIGSPPAFSNNTGVNSYANVTVQVMLNVSGFQEALQSTGGGVLKDAFLEVCDHIKSHPYIVHNVSVLCCAIDTSSGAVEYSQQQQHDPLVFFLDLLAAMRNENVSVSSLFEINLGWNHLCPFCRSEHFVRGPPDVWIPLHIPDVPKVAFAELLKDTNNVARCPECNNFETREIGVVGNPKNVVLVIQRFHNPLHKVHAAITDFRYRYVSLSRRTFTTTAIVFHKGETKENGHYVVWIRRNCQWYYCNDSVITVRQRLPRNLKDAYLIFLRRKLSSES